MTRNPSYIHLADIRLFLLVVSLLLMLNGCAGLPEQSPDSFPPYFFSISEESRTLDPKQYKKHLEEWRDARNKDASALSQMKISSLINDQARFAKYTVGSSDDPEKIAEARNLLKIMYEDGVASFPLGEAELDLFGIGREQNISEGIRGAKAAALTPREITYSSDLIMRGPRRDMGFWKHIMEALSSGSYHGIPIHSNAEEYLEFAEAALDLSATESSAAAMRSQPGDSWNRFVFAMHPYLIYEFYKGVVRFHGRGEIDSASYAAIVCRLLEAGAIYDQQLLDQGLYVHPAEFRVGSPRKLVDDILADLRSDRRDYDAELVETVIGCYEALARDGNVSAMMSLGMFFDGYHSGSMSTMFEIRLRGRGKPPRQLYPYAAHDFPLVYGSFEERGYAVADPWFTWHDPELAFSWFVKAAEMGEPSAPLKVGKRLWAVEDSRVSFDFQTPGRGVYDWFSAASDGLWEALFLRAEYCILQESLRDPDCLRVAESDYAEILALKEARIEEVAPGFFIRDYSRSEVRVIQRRIGYILEFRDHLLARLEDIRQRSVSH